MALKKEIAKNVREGLLEYIQGISDRDFQLRVWIKGEGPEVDDFAETVNSFFVLCDPVIEKPESYYLTDKEYKILKVFYKEFYDFIGHYDVNTEEMVDHPEWKKIINRAVEVLEVFDKFKSEDSDV